MEKTYYRGLHVFAAEGSSDYYVAYNEGRIQVIRTDHGSNPDYARESDKITLFDDISELYSKYDERTMHKELIEAINGIGKSIEKKFEKLNNVENIVSSLSIGPSGLRYCDSYLSTVDGVKEEIKRDKFITKAKETNEFWFIKKLFNEIGVNLTEEQIAEYAMKKELSSNLAILIKEYQEGDYEKDKKGNVWD